MKYYSTNHKSDDVTLRDAVVRGLAPDRGLYMPERLNKLPKEFFENIDKMTFQEMSFEVAKAFFGEELPEGWTEVSLPPERLSATQARLAVAEARAAACRAAGVRTCGVLWGNATREQLAAAGADVLAASMDDIVAAILP